MNTADTQPEQLAKAGFWTAVLIPPVGFVIGIVQLIHSDNRGVHTMVLSVVAALVWTLIFSTY